jgi:hypothetical protein
MEEQYPRGGAEASRQAREERMRYEVLRMLHSAAAGDPEREVRCWGFAQELGVWESELFRVLDFLDRVGLAEYCGAGPVVRITLAGVSYLERDPERTRIPDAPGG